MTLLVLSRAYFFWFFVENEIVMFFLFWWINYKNFLSFYKIGVDMTQATLCIFPILPKSLYQK